MIPFIARPDLIRRLLSLQAKLTVAADGAVETMSVTGCPTRCQKRVSTLIAQNLLFWPAFADGVPVASEHTLDIRLPLGP